MNMFKKLGNVWQPALFHGYRKRPFFFEGWYYKIGTDDGKNILAFIVGISMNEPEKNDHAFIQVLDTHTNRPHFFSFDLNQFEAKTDPFVIKVSDNHFSLTDLRINLKNNQIHINGHVQFDRLFPWPVKLNSPGVMGPYAFAPFMQCYHGILSMHHRLRGYVHFDHYKIHLDNGRGYIEKDWGRAFPKTYLWLQCNHFQDTDTSLFISVAHVPWITGAFTGFLGGLLLNNRLYRFATYTGAVVSNLSVKEQQISLTIEDRSHRLEIKILRSRSHQLQAPYDNAFSAKVHETLTATVTFTLYQKGLTGDNHISADLGHPAAFDWAGPVDTLF
ncbi:MAG: hypothetical protein GF313_00300 [Caldithrix sp.]|nr:hypothetical protein [Caldithrix sp.]